MWPWRQPCSKHSVWCWWLYNLLVFLTLFRCEHWLVFCLGGPCLLWDYYALYTLVQVMLLCWTYAASIANLHVTGDPTQTCCHSITKTPDGCKFIEINFLKHWARCRATQTHYGAQPPVCVSVWSHWYYLQIILNALTVTLKEQFTHLGLVWFSFDCCSQLQL